jgi:hypothetical protein
MTAAQNTTPWREEPYRQSYTDVSREVPPLREVLREAEEKRPRTLREQKECGVFGQYYKK